MVHFNNEMHHLSSFCQIWHVSLACWGPPVWGSMMCDWLTVSWWRTWCVFAPYVISIRHRSTDMRSCSALTDVYHDGVNLRRMFSNTSGSRLFLSCRSHYKLKSAFSLISSPSRQLGLWDHPKHNFERWRVNSEICPESCLEPKGRETALF